MRTICSLDAQGNFIWIIFLRWSATTGWDIRSAKLRSYVKEILFRWLFWLQNQSYCSYIERKGRKLSPSLKHNFSHLSTSEDSMIYCIFERLRQTPTSKISSHAFDCQCFFFSNLVLKMTSWLRNCDMRQPFAHPYSLCSVFLSDWLHTTTFTSYLHSTSRA